MQYSDILYYLSSAHNTTLKFHIVSCVTLVGKSGRMMFQYLSALQVEENMVQIIICDRAVIPPLLLDKGSHSETWDTVLFSALHSLPCFWAPSPPLPSPTQFYSTSLQGGPTIYRAWILTLSWNSREELFVMIEESELVGKKIGTVETGGPFESWKFLPIHLILCHL